MALKEILVHVDDSDRWPVRLDLAMDLARRHDARIIGLHAVPRYYVPGYVEAQIPPEVRGRQREELREARAAAEARFREMTRQGGLAAEWRIGEGDPAGAIGMNAHYADLVVLGQVPPDEGSMIGAGDLVELVVMDSACPTVVVPYVGAYPTAGGHMVVAWDASREATRAIRDAMPVLEKAEKVTVLTVNPRRGERGHGEIPGADMALHLARHGVRATAESVPARDLSVGDALLSWAADSGAGLLVMGAYGHARIREVVLGGATRHILRHMTVPVLMSR